ncbi:hypothetical protein KSP39_PZI021901 [Platanthera zijinensis]|uniref:BED-type domain-containing protein n=1 Tax=Platanthera zijinensis TaxID=2320716 RepID=A0AAP0AX19_9ASPA
MNIINTIENCSDSSSSPVEDDEFINPDANAIINDLNVQDIELVPISIGPTPTEPSLGQQSAEVEKDNKGKRKRSEVWEHFKVEKLKDRSGNIVSKWQCKHCSKTYKYQLSGSTSNCARHIKTCYKLIQVRKNQTMFNQERVTICVSGSYDSVSIRQLLAKFIITAELPFSIIEQPYFNIYSKALNPNYVKISRHTMKNECMKLYEVEREKLLKILKKVDKVALTSDCWTSNQSIGYLCITVHYIDSDWKLQHSIISFLDLDPPHSGQVIYDAIRESILHWGIQKKVMSITLDNASANDLAAKHLQQSLANSNHLYLGGKLFHIRCCAHILNILVQEGLKEISLLINIVREAVGYIKKSPARLKLFAESAKLLGISTSRGLSSDVKTRWNSTYYMLDSAFHYRYVIHHFFRKDKGLVWDFPEEIWQRFVKIKNILEVFESATKLFSGTSYPTSNLFLPALIAIKEVLDKASISDDEFVRGMAKPMKNKFDKYWSDCSLIMSLAIVLDPRRKLLFITYAFNKLYNNREAVLKVKVVKESIFEIFSHYCANSESSSSTRVGVMRHSSATTQPQCITNSVIMGFDDFLSSTSSVQPLKNELEVYLEEALVQPPFESRDTFNVLEWWKIYSLKYVKLSKMAKDILTIPITTVASESAFSAGGRVLDDYRSALNPKTVNALVCSSNWIRSQHKHRVNVSTLITHELFY